MKILTWYCRELYAFYRDLKCWWHWQQRLRR